GAGAGGGMDGMRVGIVGAGWIGAQHHRTLESIEGVDIVAVCDVDRGRSEALTNGTGARACADWLGMLDDAYLAAVLSSTRPSPPPGLCPPVIAPAGRGAGACRSTWRSRSPARSRMPR